MSDEGTVALTPAPPFVDVARITEPEFPLVPVRFTNQEPADDGFVIW